MAWALSNHPESADRAVMCLDRLEQQPGLAPNRSCFRYVLKAIGKSSDRSSNIKAQSAFDMLQRMKASFASGNRRAEPSVHEYLSTLRAIGSSRTTESSLQEQMNAYELVEELFLDCLSRGALQFPDPASERDGYEQLCLQYLWAAFKLLPADEERNRTLQRVLRSCPAEVRGAPAVQRALHKVTFRRTYDATVHGASRRPTKKQGFT